MTIAEFDGFKPPIKAYASLNAGELAQHVGIGAYDVLDKVEADHWQLDNESFVTLRDVLAYLRKPWHYDRAAEVEIIVAKQDGWEAIVAEHLHAELEHNSR